MLSNNKLIHLFVLPVIIFISTAAYSMDFIVGARAGYFVWHPYFQEMDGSGMEEVETGAGVLYGPALSVLFTDKISFSAVTLYGKQSTYWHNNDTAKVFGTDDITSTGTFYTEITRIDFDSAASYRLSEHFKVFIGYKYQYTETELRGTFIRSKTDEENVYDGDIKIKIPSHGPALGIGYSSTIGSNFFVSFNLSALYMFSKFKFSKTKWTSYDPADPYIPYNESGSIDSGSREYDTQQVGLNAEPSFGISVANVVATLGFRFQWVRIKFIDEPVSGNVTFAPSGWMNDYLYGIFFGALYQF